MSHELLGNIWYILLCVLWIGFLILESFASGVGMIFKSSRSEKEGRVLQYTVGPYWDGSEVWFITAGGATFAAFPLVYAEVFSSLYVALYLLLMMLITRGVAMELVYKDDSKKWQSAMGWAWTISSYGLALLLGVRFANLFMKANTLTESTNDFFGLLSRTGVLGGLLFIGLYRTGGVLWANVKAGGDVVTRLRKQIVPVAIVPALIMPLMMMAFNWKTNLFATNFADFPVLWVLPVIAMLCPIATLLFAVKKRYGLALVSNSLSIAMFMIVGFSGVFPYMAPGITVTKGMASELTLQIMTVVALVFVPVVLAYQGWKFLKFSRKITTQYFDEPEAAG